jgi:hypothetical protein
VNGIHVISGGRLLGNAAGQVLCRRG